MRLCHSQCFVFFSKLVQQLVNTLSTILQNETPQRKRAELQIPFLDSAIRALHIPLYSLTMVTVGQVLAKLIKYVKSPQYMFGKIKKTSSVDLKTSLRKPSVKQQKRGLRLRKLLLRVHNPFLPKGFIALMLQIAKSHLPT